MPAISKIRLTNIVFEEGQKRYNNETFLFDGHNGAILLENGGGKTVFIQTVLQAILPHTPLAQRKIKDTLQLENAPAHIAIEWILNEQPRRYMTTCVSLFLTKNSFDSLRYVYEYEGKDDHSIDNIPFVRTTNGKKRPADRGEMLDYYSAMREKSVRAQTFQTKKEYQAYIEEQYQIIESEWESIVKINSTEGGVEAFFDECKSTSQLFDRLLIPTVEDSIAGHNKNSFADLFEKQRESFHSYKRLKESIEENKQIQQELEQYVQIFEKLHSRQIEYIHVKEQAKGTWNIINYQKSATLKEQDIVKKHKLQWDLDQQQYERKQASYKILLEEQLLQEKEQAFQQIVLEHEELQEKYEKKKTYYYSLKLAELKATLKNNKEKLQYLENELRQFEQSEEIIDFEEQLNETKRMLLGSYREEMEQISKEMQRIVYETNPLMEQLEKNTKQYEEQVVNKQENEKQQAKLKGQGEGIKKHLEKLTQQLLANPEQERVVDLLPDWNDRIQFLDEEIIRLEQLIKQLNNQLSESEEKKEFYNEERNKIITLKTTNRAKQEQLQKAHQQLIENLKAVRPQWVNIESIYLQQETVEARLKEDISQTNRLREDWLYRERLAYRFVDDYENQESFFADSFFAEQLKLWRNQFDYVTTGVEFLQQMDEDARIVKQQYLLWPLSIITTSNSKEKLIQKVQQVSDRLAFPIAILTIEEASNIETESGKEAWISPQHWHENVNQTNFVQWKKQIGEKAHNITHSRKETEELLSFKEQALNKLQHYLLEFPHDVYEELKGEENRLQHEEETVLLNLKREDAYSRECKKELETIAANVKRYKEEKNGLENKVEKASDYLQYEKELIALIQKERQYDLINKELDQKVAQIAHQLERLNDEIQECYERKNEIKFNLRNMEENHEYKSVKHLEPIYSGQSRTIILTTIKDLEFKIRKITTTRGALVARHEAALNVLQLTEQQINDLRLEHRNLLDDLHYPVGGLQHINTLLEKLPQLENEMLVKGKERTEKQSEHDIQSGKVDQMLEHLQEIFQQGRIQFSENIFDIQASLQAEQTRLAKQNDYLEQTHLKVEQQLKDIEFAERELEKFEESHHFTAPDIVGVTFTEDVITEFTYNRKAFVQKITELLKQKQQDLASEAKQVEHAKRAFRAFCHTVITDVKMRNMALNGIEYKQSYEDIIAFRNNMMISVERATHYANEHIRQKDAEMQAFINQIHNHLQTVVEELRHIPNTTKVKVGDTWKQIFNFIIPDWQEDEGKNRIRDHIEWILSQLESDRFLNDQGMEDSGKVRKEIETWLQSKQLLQIVMNNEVMKVSCRKVTNDGNVSTRSYSWEQSNIWSGGEKWSKNMTLFLGILKYVSEKRHHAQTKMKRYRTVILDNPFGKASSDHVLNPVFFVAEQLGFQMIALTAHAEGKFLQDYFPIIYSCRLRASKDSNKNIMTKEKWLHHAYFQDHEPLALDRLGEKEQMTLFE
ncbi:hypothetical protein ACOMCU_08880 [Lysinibacillus sp. UGB7]|uniref:hypothetical protein n=1 Tax=Lysinibacillus sp. UGB7 TaxID=3411039 RepID=UPI003B7F95EB